VDGLAGVQTDPFDLWSFSPDVGFPPTHLGISGRSPQFFLEGRGFVRDELKTSAELPINLYTRKATCCPPHVSWSNLG